MMQFHTAGGVELNGPREWEPGIVAFDLEPGSWEDATFLINGLPAPVYASRRWGSTRVMADWPRSGPGAYRLELRCGQATARQIVTIGSAKLGDEGFATLLGDLEHRLPASIALSLQRAGALVGIALQPIAENTLEQELLRLRRAILGFEGSPGLATLLPAIAANPHHMLTREDVWVRRERARRVPVTGLVRALTSPGNFDSARLPERVLDGRVEHTVDVYENRLLKAFTLEVAARLRRLQAIAANNVAVAGIITELDQSLRVALRRASFLDDVTLPAHLPERLTMVLMRHPHYSAVLNRYTEFRRSIWARLADDHLDSPLTNLPALYQTWGTLEVIACTLDTAIDLGFRLVQQRIAQRRPNAVFVEVLKDGQPALELFHEEAHARVTLTPERTFGSSGALHSVSFAQRPDVVVQIDHSERPSELLVFDPKYKLDADEEGAGTPVKSDVDKMHAYRDAIRDTSDQHVVRFAGTLYPGVTAHYGTGVAAIGAMPGRSGELQVAVRAILVDALGGAAGRDGGGQAPADSSDTT